MSRPLPETRGPFRADQIRPGDPYELSNGHAIFTMGTGGRGSRANLVGGSVLETDPAVEEAGIDTGYAPSPDTLRAPDVAVGNVPDAPGWVDGAPPLAVEYADTGQDEKDLAKKISELFAAGTQLIWVVRLTGPRQVEVHEPGRAMRLAGPGDELRAPGILQNPVLVEALYDRKAAHQATLRNLLQRRGYQDLDEVRAEGRVQALRDAVLAVLSARGLSADDTARAALDGCRDLETLQRWLAAAAVAGASSEIFTTED